ncbi:bis(5'-nucleosyl)-tetraphosphatase [Candidatus Clavichlamydia salmonicola]|uniref:bis(5'-nucleosyl)-tetraphosphatase n=1 Tax=Candidatus Clavichlamydia salmonicola TaxID=469812 RepID=UPI001891E8B9|nr:NUDIX domain-containing protein [Candidatus Clavichlamydia salmonicola]
MNIEGIKEYAAGIIPLQKNADNEWKVFLIKHRYGGHVGFPKGHVEKEETFQETAQRELKEETGLEVSSFLPIESFEVSYSFFFKGDYYQKTVWYFTAIVQGEVVLQAEEIKDGTWYSLADAAKEIHFQSNKDICQTVINQLKILQ